MAALAVQQLRTRELPALRQYSHRGQLLLRPIRQFCHPRLADIRHAPATTGRVRQHRIQGQPLWLVVQQRLDRLRQQGPESLRGDHWQQHPHDADAADFFQASLQRHPGRLCLGQVPGHSADVAHQCPQPSGRCRRCRAHGRVEYHRLSRWPLHCPSGRFRYLGDYLYQRPPVQYAVGELLRWPRPRRFDRRSKQQRRHPHRNPARRRLTCRRPGRSGAVFAKYHHHGDPGFQYRRARNRHGQGDQLCASRPGGVPAAGGLFGCGWGRDHSPHLRFFRSRLSGPRPLDHSRGYFRVGAGQRLQGVDGFQPPTEPRRRIPPPANRPGRRQCARHFESAARAL